MFSATFSPCAYGEPAQPGKFQGPVMGAVGSLGETACERVRPGFCWRLVLEDNSKHSPGNQPLAQSLL